MSDPRPRLWHRLLRPLQISRFGRWFFLKLATPIDRVLVRLSNGRASLTFGYPTLVLISRGAKSGLPRETPLLFLPDGTRMIVIASNTGKTTHPAWYHNLSANPEAEVIANGRRFPVVAREAYGAEREALWRRIIAMNQGYRDYERLAGQRLIPVMVLTPED